MDTFTEDFLSKTEGNINITANDSDRNAEIYNLKVKLN
jgi:hypothetical protein